MNRVVTPFELNPMVVSKKRQAELMRLVFEGGDELTVAMTRGKIATESHLRRIRLEILRFVRTCENKEELHFFAENWNWDGNVKPILKLITNPYVDAGTLLRLYWYGCPEDYYLFYKNANEIEEGFERDVFNVLRRIENRILKGTYLSKSYPFDPAPRITMWERRSEFARQIPEVMYQPIRSQKTSRTTKSG